MAWMTSSNLDANRPSIQLEARPDWHKRAACAGVDPDLFFPVRGDNVPREVQAICAACPVRADCLEAGLWEKNGVWGGTSERERRRIRKQRRLALAS